VINWDEIEPVGELEKGIQALKSLKNKRQKYGITY